VDIVPITVKTALVRSRIAGVEYVINPYLGCAHGCSYCYAAFMRKYSHFHARAPWGSFVEVKTNMVELLQGELERRRKGGTVLLSSVCDPYQPAEKHARLTRGCLERLMECQWDIEILTRSPLVVRDLDLLRDYPRVSVGFSIATDDDRVRAVLEPSAPPIERRVQALRALHEAGVSTRVFIAPILPMNPERLHNLVASYADKVLIDRLNYPEKVHGVFKRHGWESALGDRHVNEVTGRLVELFGGRVRLV
jgi:DNA repair photolyase